MQNRQILIGLDYYYDLLTVPGNGIRTPCGLHIAKTVFGRAIYGRGISKASDAANTPPTARTATPPTTPASSPKAPADHCHVVITPPKSLVEEKKKIQTLVIKDD
ncbi:hypothetical protein RB195_018429 [Necator americanus]|uniref:Peptidase aspartic putative domain-containing protein n=1 Tax=Necator americanus TaxID=51031 RepID=A0ABR1CCQ2_NECAM